METLPTAKLELDPEAILGPDGPIAKHFSNYEPRPAQIEMSQAVRSSMQRYRHLFCEAGTGTGKSYAFLIPAIEAALRGEGPVVISTNTISLQEQIFYKDIPDLKKYLGLDKLKVVLRKGRGNYVSLRRQKLAQNYDWSNDQISQLEELDTWVDQTKTGALQDLDFVPNSTLWQHVQSDQYDCLGQKCDSYKSCFFFKSKQEAEEAHLVITNHSLLAIDLMLRYKSGGDMGILPKFKHVVIDEAHALEDAIRKAETFEWREGSAKHIVKRATDSQGRGLLDKLSKASASHVVSPRMLTNIRDATNALNTFAAFNEEFFKDTVIPFAESHRKRANLPVAKRVRPKDLNTDGASKMLGALKVASERLIVIDSELQKGAQEQDAEKWVKEISSLISNYSSRVSDLLGDLKRTIEADKKPDQQYPTHVSAVEVTIRNSKAYYQLSSTPIFVKLIANKILFGRVPSIVATSATLTVNGQFDNITRNLGTVKDKTETLQLPHVFDYRKQVKIFLEPKARLSPYGQTRKQTDAYYDDIAERTAKYVDMTKGNAFVLCTSNAQKRALHERLASRFLKKGYNVLVQGGHLTKEQIIHEFKAVSGSVLFAVDSFWTGVDIPGDHLQAVIITKLPFAAPSPLSEAQEEFYKAWNQGRPRHKQRYYFADRTIPGVAIKLQQGFGRLIRHRDDTGIVAILDPRMETKPYGKTLLGSLPPCQVISS